MSCKLKVVVHFLRIHVVPTSVVRSTNLSMQKPVGDVNKHLRPISLTPILSKMSEDYVVDTYVKPAVLEWIDPQQFGAVPKSSTTHALISMLHSWNRLTEMGYYESRTI